MLPRYDRYEGEIKEGLLLLFLSGVSTRTVELISKRLLGRTLSHAEVRSANLELTAAVEAWRMRDLSSLSIKYLYLDGMNFDMRIEGSVQKVPVLAAVGGRFRGDEARGRHAVGRQGIGRQLAGVLPGLEEAGAEGRAAPIGDQRELPSATKCLSQSLESCLTFYKFPQEEWISIRTTNIIERLNKEFKRRTSRWRS